VDPKEPSPPSNSRAFAVGILGAMTVTVPLEMGCAPSLARLAAFFALATPAASAAVFYRRAGAQAHGRADSLAVALGGVARADCRCGVPGAPWLMVSASQCAAMSLGTLWIATWLRDVAGYDPVQVGRGCWCERHPHRRLLAFGRLARLRARRGASTCR